jgi:hypothetical protein
VPLVPRPLAVIGTVGTALAAVRRIHQGAHEPADVLAGIALGVGVALVVTDVISQLP